jgi:hypothetical protein
MSTKTNTSRTDSEFGVSIFVGAVFCLAIYGAYKLFQKESNRDKLLESGTDAAVIKKLLD